MKQKFEKKIYKRLYPSSSRPGLYFGLAKVHKLKDDRGNLADLPLRPVVSNIGTATYETSKYLARLLQPLAKSEYTIESTKDFISKLQGKKIPKNFELVSFDVVSLFTKVPLDFTIRIILDKVYKDKIIKTKLKRNQMKKLLEMCTKEAHFSFNGNVFKQKNGVAMGSPLGPVIANIFMVELEKRLVPAMNGKVSLWFRYVDDTFTFIKKGEIDAVVRCLNGFHESIKFTFEKEENREISFLDVKVIRKDDGTFDTDIYRKKTDTNIYLSWNAFAPRSWKVGTLKGLVRRAFLVCSVAENRNKEIRFLKNVFIKVNGYPSRVVNKVVNDVRSKIITTNRNGMSQNRSDEIITSVPVNSSESTSLPNNEEVHSPYICLPFRGVQGEQIVRRFKGALKKALPMNVQPRFVYKGKKLSDFFRIKDKVPREHESNLIYAFKSEDTPKYVGETKVRIGTRSHEHCSTDKASAVYKYAEANNLHITGEDFSVLEKGYPKTVDRKLAEALYVKEMDPILNRQKKLYKLLLFN